MSPNLRVASGIKSLRIWAELKVRLSQKVASAWTGLSGISCLGHNMRSRSVHASQTEVPAVDLPAIPAEMLESFGKGHLTGKGITINQSSLTKLNSNISKGVHRGFPSWRKTSSSNG